MAASINSGRHQGVWYTVTLALDSELFYIYHTNGNKQALLSRSCQNSWTLDSIEQGIALWALG